MNLLKKSSERDESTHVKILRASLVVRNARQLHTLCWEIQGWWQTSRTIAVWLPEKENRKIIQIICKNFRQRNEIVKNWLRAKLKQFIF